MEFLLPRNDLKDQAMKRNKEYYHQEEKLKNEMLKQYKNEILNFQKGYSNIKNFDDPLEDEELYFNDKVYFMVPPSVLLEPSYVITFELILLDKNLASASDRVYAWGAFPLLDFDLQVNNGWFKLPLILGRYVQRINKFKDIEGRIKRNIDEWVSNLYIQIRSLRVEECTGHKEKLTF